MHRRLHSLPGLVAALLLLVLALSGSILSLSPVLERVGAIVPARGVLSVAQVAEKVLLVYPETEQIERLPSGAVLVYFTLDGNSGADLINPMTGERLATYQSSAFFSWIKDLHRAFLWDDRGRAAAGICAPLMVLMCFSGLFLLAARMGGWRKLFAPIRGSGMAASGVAEIGAISAKWHTELARIAAVGLLLSALTACWMSAVRFEWLSDAADVEASFPQSVAGTSPALIGSLLALKQVDLTDLHQLIFPSRHDPQDVYALRTHQGSGYIDQATGQWLAYADYGNAAKLQTLVMELHTGEAYWWLGLILGLAALTVPVLAITGPLIWWQRRSTMPALVGNSPHQLADTIVLVGSETNTTWGFASSLLSGLNQAGCRVHVAPMNALTNQYPKAQRLLILTSTYGDGDAPASATQFLQRLAKLPESVTLPWAVLGFGDRQFGCFCAFAQQVSQQLQQKQWPQLLATDFIDRQSGTAFEHWGTALGTAMGIALAVRYTPLPRVTRRLQLFKRQDYGQAVNAFTCILRFKSGDPGKSLPSFAAGDLVGIVLPEDYLDNMATSETLPSEPSVQAAQSVQRMQRQPTTAAPRFYSLASTDKDGVLEICVRHQAKGLCSGYLTGLKPGDIVDGFIQKNPRFKPAKGNSPILLIGAGTGIGPLIGFIRANKSQRPMYLFWGGRLATSDFLYQDELNTFLSDKRLTELHPAFSRGPQPAYVQDKLLQNAGLIQQLLANNAQILICGGRVMATDVSHTLDAILEPQTLNVASLKKSGRFIEDTY